ncbi:MULTISPECIES: hypothetical protein [Aliiroseovarius]|nr:MULTISPECIES: hypothetical protein [Aliiroseovarius]UWP88550.1 BrnA antitoxin family protein [Aliiroseovarius crassostreae]UWQ04327.1 BrnA antitoxin family protein [Aliiroseovarius crassostreae]
MTDVTLRLEMPLQMLVDLKRSADVTGISVEQYIRDLIRSRSFLECTGGSDTSEPPFSRPLARPKTGRVKAAS